MITAADLRCPCCHVQLASARLLTALNTLELILHRKLTINSGYRCQLHNAAVSGAPHSKHPTGQAADVTVPGLSPPELYLAADQIPDFANGGIGLYPAPLIHLDVRTSRARWFRIDGKDHPITDYLIPRP